MNEATPPRALAVASRRAGVLLPLSSLGEGHGALGRAAREFIDWIAAAGFTAWQLLPIGHRGADGSPYWLRSDHAADPDYLDERDLPDGAFDAARDGSPLHGEFEAWCVAERDWIDDYALFEAFSAAQGGAPWQDWPPAWRDRDRNAIAGARTSYAEAIAQVKLRQFLTAHAWRQLREYARERGVLLFGDLPIYVAPDSVETWRHREQFQLDGAGRPSSLAGVPPDYFAADGQLWGNPLYDWPRMQAEGFGYWRARVRTALRRFDLLRLDHFRGLVECWAVPANARTAREGHWQPAGADALFIALQAELPAGAPSPFVAEDLGIITPDVEALRARWALPGMRVLQFAFDGSPANPYLPHRLQRESIVYTGTHDNDTSLGWYRGLDPATRERVDLTLGSDAARMPGSLVHCALASVAQLAVVPIQDLLGLDSRARINTPGTTSGNWGWQLPQGALTAPLATELARLNAALGRSANIS